MFCYLARRILLLLCCVTSLSVDRNAISKWRTGRNVKKTVAGTMQGTRKHTPYCICVRLSKNTNNLRTTGLRDEIWTLEHQNRQQLVYSLKHEFRLDCLFNQFSKNAGLCYWHRRRAVAMSNNTENVRINIEVRSRNHCCRGKAISITYS